MHDVGPPRLPAIGEVGGELRHVPGELIVAERPGWAGWDDLH